MMPSEAKKVKCHEIDIHMSFIQLFISRIFSLNFFFFFKYSSPPPPPPWRLNGGPLNGLALW